MDITRHTRRLAAIMATAASAPLALATASRTTDSPSLPPPRSRSCPPAACADGRSRSSRPRPPSWPPSWPLPPTGS
jgi:hypothetical protein